MRPAPADYCAPGLDACCDSRRDARTDAAGDLVVLEGRIARWNQQDRRGLPLAKPRRAAAQSCSGGDRDAALSNRAGRRDGLAAIVRFMMCSNVPSRS
jgi:hypothetical protein